VSSGQVGGGAGTSASGIDLGWLVCRQGRGGIVLVGRVSSGEVQWDIQVSKLVGVSSGVSDSERVTDLGDYEGAVCKTYNQTVQVTRRSVVRYNTGGHSLMICRGLAALCWGLRVGR
jgi:hypothetical protein